MIKKVSLYLQFHSFYFLLLFGVFVLPLALFFQFSEYPLPKIQYVFLGTLFFSQYAFYNEKAYRRKITSRVSSGLQKELKKIPSISQVNTRETFLVLSRNGTIVFMALSILVIMVYFKQF